MQNEKDCFGYQLPADCAVCGNAEYIVSNDSHFRVLNDIEWPRLQLVTIQEYVKEIE